MALIPIHAPTFTVHLRPRQQALPPQLEQQPQDVYLPGPSPSELPSAHQIRQLCSPRSLEDDCRVISQNRSRIKSGDVCLQRGQDGRLNVLPQHTSLDTLKSMEEYVRGGQSQVDSGQFLKAEVQEEKATVNAALRGLGNTVLHPLANAHSVIESAKKSGPALVEFSRNSAAITRDGAQRDVHVLTSGSPREAGQAWGGLLATTGMSLAPFPSMTRITGLMKSVVGSSERLLQNLGPLENTKLYRIGEASSGRNALALRPSDQKVILNYIHEHYQTPKGGVHFRKIGHTEYAAGNLDALKIGPDVMPNPTPKTGTLSANSRVSLKGCIAHELEGHRRAALAHKTQTVPCLEEAQASIRAARFGKALSSQERTTLLRDAISRLHNGGYKVRDVKNQLWIEKR